MQILMFIIATAILILIIKLYYKKCKTGVEKIVLILYGITYFTPILIYYLDLWNIPSLLNLTNNINTQNWLSFLSSYTSSIVSTILGVTASIYLALYQIRKNNESNEKRDKENLRLQNMPLLTYKIETTGYEYHESDIYRLIKSNCDEKTSILYDLFISIKNIGLNNVKRIIADVETSVLNNTERIIGKDTLTPVEKNETLTEYRYFNLDSGKEYEMKLKVYYQDVLQNWYCQIVDVSYNATKIHEGSNSIGVVKYKVNEEVLIDSKEIPEL